MNLGNYLQAFSRLKASTQRLCGQYGCSPWSIYFDFFWSRLIYGVTPNEYIGWEFYAKNRRERNTYYTARHFHRYERILNSPDYYDTFWDKPKFLSCFSSFVKREWLNAAESSEDDILGFLKRHPDAIVKPTNQSSGKGIHHYEGESASMLKKANALLEERIIQINEMAIPNPSSVNSIRVYTILDREGIPHILSACMRVGGYGSTTDNFHSGGVAYPIDLQYGTIAKAGGDMNGIRHLFHPGTGARMIGFQVPEWSELVDYITRVATHIPEARMIAWDVAITPDGFDLIEGNYNGDPGILQTPMQKGLLRQIKKYK